MARLVHLVLVTVPLLLGCSDFPDLDAAISEQGRLSAYPRLQPINQELFTRFTGEPDSEAEIAWLSARAAGLRRRARALTRRPIVDDRTRRRMAAALERHFEKGSELLR